MRWEEVGVGGAFDQDGVFRFRRQDSYCSAGEIGGRCLTSRKISRVAHVWERDVSGGEELIVVIAVVVFIVIVFFSIVVVLSRLSW